MADPTASRSLAAKLRIAIPAGAVLALLVVVALALRDPAVRAQATPEHLHEVLLSFTTSPWFVLEVLLAYIAAGFVLLSVWIVNFQVGVLVPPPWGTLLAFAGSMTSAAFFYGLGRLLGKNVVEAIAGPRITQLVRGAGFPGVLIARLLPIAPFSVANLAAGAFGVRVRDYAFGTMLGMVPGILISTLFGSAVIDLVEHPTPKTFAAVGVVLVALVLAGLIARRWVKRAQARRAASAVVVDERAR